MTTAADIAEERRLPAREEIAAMLTGDAQSGRHLRHLETEGVLTANRDDDEIV